jgi:hypothetical protein
MKNLLKLQLCLATLVMTSLRHHQCVTFRQGPQSARPTRSSIR